MKSFLRLIALLLISCAIVQLDQLSAQTLPPIKILKTKIQGSQPVDSEIIKTIQAHINTTKYREVRVQIVRDSLGNPSHYLVQLFAKNSHRVDFSKIVVDQHFKVLSVQQNYKLQDIDFKQQSGPLQNKSVEPESSCPIKILNTRVRAAQPPNSKIVKTIRTNIDISKYREVRTQLIRDTEGKPSHYLVYLFSKTYHKVEFAKIAIDQKFKALGVERNYKLVDIDFKQQLGELAHSTCPDCLVQFIAFAPNDIQLEQDVTIDVANTAIAANLKTVELLKDQATRENYLNYMTCPKLQGNFYDGDANPQVITTVDGVVSSDDINTILNGKFQYRTTNYWLACEAYNDPMLSAVINTAQTKKYAAGINNLLVGPSDRTAACAMKAAIAGNPMHASFNSCYQQLDVQTDNWGYGGNGTDNFWSEGFFCGSFPNPVIKYDHKDADGRIYIPVLNWADYSNDLFRAAPEFPPCGQNINSSRTWVDIYNADSNVRMYGFCALNNSSDLKSIWFLPSTPHGNLYIMITDRGCDNIYKSNTIPW